MLELPDLDIMKICGHTPRTSGLFRNALAYSQHTSVEQASEKIIFFEDVDLLFRDEEESFYGQLTRLIQQSKVPIIVSATSRESISTFIEDFLEHDGVRHKIFNFKVKQNPVEWQQAVLTIIHGLENLAEGKTLGPCELQANNSITQTLN